MNDVNSDQKSIIKNKLANLNGLAEVEEVINSKFKSDAKLLNQIPAYLLDLGGKRMRPALCMLVAAALNCKTPPKELIQIAAGIELIHMATLLHDDIIDNASIRRHKESAFKKFGLANTLLAGDFLLTRAFSLCAHLDQYIIEATEEACIELTEGEILETPMYFEKHDLNSYLNVAKKKTASLFRLAAESAAHLTGTAEQAKHFRIFGESLGIAFQILDDVLDVTAAQDLLGKESGSDLREKKPSAVNVLWLETGSDLAKELLLNEHKISQDEITMAIQEIKSLEVISQAKNLALNYSKQAQASLDQISSCGSFNAESLLDLKLLLNFTLSRGF